MPVNTTPIPASRVIRVRQMLWHMLHELPRVERNAERPLNELRSFALGASIHPAGRFCDWICGSIFAFCEKFIITKTSKLYMFCKAFFI